MTDEERNSIEVQAGSWKARFIGVDTKTILVAVLILVALGGIAYQREEDRRTDRENRSMYLEQHKVTQGMIGSMITNQRAIMDMIQQTKAQNHDDIGEVAWLMTKTQAQREALKMEMPQSLRKKLNER